MQNKATNNKKQQKTDVNERDERNGQQVSRVDEEQVAQPQGQQQGRKNGDQAQLQEEQVSQGQGRKNRDQGQGEQDRQEQGAPQGGKQEADIFTNESNQGNSQVSAEQQRRQQQAMEEHGRDRMAQGQHENRAQERDDLNKRGQ